MRRARAVAMALAYALAMMVPATAQTTRPPSARAKSAPKAPQAGKKKPATDRKSEAPGTAAGPAKADPSSESRPYDAQLMRLAEVMGALAFLRDLCKAGDGDDWRDKMTTLLDADAPTGPRRQRMIGAFNRGFRGFELTYRGCTPNAEAAIARYLAEADRITADFEDRYGRE